MAAGLGMLALAVAGLFGIFMTALGYAQWSTRGIEVHRAQ